MSQHCCEHETPAIETLQNPARYRRILWIALLINAAMFGVEIVGGLTSGSLSLMADAIDFAGDALNYGVSLAVLSAALAWRARARGHAEGFVDGWIWTSGPRTRTLERLARRSP